MTGLSKIARLVDLYARRPRCRSGSPPDRRRPDAQTRSARCHCRRRGRTPVHGDARVRKPGAVTTTSAVRGQFKTDAASRAEALELILRK
ncbi:putative gTP cyclohydrolase 1 [Mycobacterium xenopi 3993]|nr:putative gTP cyclohydrolase 1 [Mycobacterium xenopi 3993]